MNILFINSLRKNRWGGGEKWMVTAAAGLRKRGHTCLIGALPNSVIEKKALEKDVPVVEFNIKSDLDIFALGKLKNILNKLDIDVLVCCQNKDVKIGGRAARKVGTKAIFSRQGLQLFTNKQRYKYPFTQLVDGIITNTHSIKEIYEGFGWFPKDFIHVIYNGMDAPVLNPAINKAEVFGVKEDRKVVLSAGRLSHQKGFKYLIEAAKICKDKNLPYQFFIAGSGKLEADLKSLTSELGVEEQVTFLGFIEDLSPFYQTADMFVLPSLYEGMPNVVMEAMAHGTPCISTRVNGADELLKNGAMGYLIDPENPQQIADKLEAYFNSAKSTEHLGTDSRDYVKENYSVDTMSEKLERLFDNQIKS